NRAQLRSLPARGLPLLGVFSDSHVPYALDRLNDDSLADTPSLPEMFSTALAQLKDAEEGFFLQVEAGRVDHAGHANDPGAILHEQLEYDACIPMALDYIDKHPDTLLIVTTDHGTGGCQLDGKGSAYSGSGPALVQMNQFKYSFEWLERHFRKAGGFEAALFTQATGISASNEQISEIEAAIKDPQVSYLSSKMTAVFEEELKEISAVGWSSNNHTSECVELLAFGPGSEQIPGFIQNNDLHGIMTSALRI
ncbi:MAG: alkaline phosphatase, partial [Opitutales bacterium]